MIRSRHSLARRDRLRQLVLSPTNHDTSKVNETIRSEAVKGETCFNPSLSGDPGLH